MSIDAAQQIRGHPDYRYSLCRIAYTNLIPGKKQSTRMKTVNRVIRATGLFAAEAWTQDEIWVQETLEKNVEDPT